MISRIPCHPIDTIKARLQADASSGNPRYRNFVHGLSATMRTEGLRGLYRGFFPTMIGSGPASVLYFTSYEVTKSALTELPEGARMPDELNFFVAGMVAEAFSCILWVPIDVVKERMQIQKVGGGGTYYKSGADAIVQISRGEGIRGLYKGYWATLASFGPNSALYFMFYEWFKAFAQRRLELQKTDLLPMGWQIGTACAAGGLASWLTNPLDMVKLRLQVQRGEASEVKGGLGFKYRGMADGLKAIVTNEGFRGLWKGSGARVVFSAAMATASMSLFERCKNWVKTLLNTN
ncbi:mitochondrial carrier family [Hyaloraphidium curvatum]|nr:mitochondrial carrier family [Hyaloraphidium curvatum]